MRKQKTTEVKAEANKADVKSDAVKAEVKKKQKRMMWQKKYLRKKRRLSRNKQQFLRNHMW